MAQWLNDPREHREHLAQGAMVVVRPDQHVAHVLLLDGLDALAAFFAPFMLERLAA